jgi:hypothetical protein
MAFHESFWVVEGTAAPVIALAAVLSTNDIFEGFMRVIADPRVAQLGRDEQSREQRGSEILTWVFLQFANICIQAAVLGISLWSLAIQSNVIPPWICIVITCAAVVLLAAAGVVTVTRNKGMEYGLAQLERMEREAASGSRGED